ncbi:phosphatase PAP2 family protein [Bergeyella zoohelcum]|uniref:Undecaprenyl pyrophosphate phosphatase n=1 Tax=Bergeyella zoohelcum TaxID=1015 RepID=A0A7Z8YQ08_9FLAO|nr:phosphatase PAP2 family protein [Bergeyella zoohelcum]VDH05899.1 undecaprenyl pyrophosphate phosphatase [Bergeyella zoohelcum]
MEEIILQDKNALIFLNTLGSESFDSFWLTATKVWIWLPLFTTALYLLVKNYGWKKLLYFLIFIGLGIAVSDQLTNIFKISVGRLRPCHDETLEGLIREVTCGGQFSFYSAHASNSFFIATFLTHFLKEKAKGFGVIIFLWASVFAYSRIYLGVHFPLDILTGAIMGFIIGKIFAYLTQKTFEKQAMNSSS